MITHYIDVADKWGVLFIYDFDWNDVDEMAAIMDSFGMSERNIRKSMRILFDKNTGMTVSREDLRMSAIFVGCPTSVEQFADTIAHETDHVQSAICDYYNVPYGSEDAAWLQGYIIRGIAHEIKKDLF